MAHDLLRGLLCPIFLHRLEVSPKVESSSVTPPNPPHSPVPPQCSSASPSGHASSDGHTKPFTPSSSPTSTPISPSNPFLPRMQCNPFFEELIAEESQKSPPLASCSSSDSPAFHYTTVPSQPRTSSPTDATNMTSIKRERPRPVARQVSLPAFAGAAQSPPHHSATRSMSDNAGEWDDSFDAFASSRLNSPKGSLPPKQLTTSATSFHRHSYGPVNSNNHAHELQTFEEEPPPLPPRRLLRTPVNEIYSDGWLHRGQELAVHKEAYLLSQTGVASLQRGKEGECKRNSISPDPHTNSETSDSLSAHSQPCRNITSPGLVCEEKLQKFKYEPLENDSDCWGGMLFEQDLYGHAYRGNYRKPKVKDPCLSVNTVETTVNNLKSKNSGPQMFLDSEMSVTDLLSHRKVPVITTTPTESDPTRTTRANNNDVRCSQTLGDPNMNVNNSDFSFIDSDGSSQSDVPDALRSATSFGASTFRSQVTVYHKETAPEDLFTLKDTYIPEMNSSFEITASSNNLCKVSPVCQDCRCELNNAAPQSHCGVFRDVTALLPSNQASNSPAAGGDSALKNTHTDFDDNGNLADLSKPSKTESFPGVVSARFRPKGVSRQNSRGSPNSRSNMGGDTEFEQLLSLVQNISVVRDGPLSHQHTNSALSSLVALDTQSDMVSSKNDFLHHNESNAESQVSHLKDNTVTGKRAEIRFEDLHAKVAPSSKTLPKSKIGPDSSSPSVPPALSLSADAQANLHPTLLCCTSMHPSSIGPSGASITLAVAPYTSSYSTTTTSDQPLVDARHSLVPEETQPANNLPHQESR